MIKKYEDTVQSRDVRYINYCNLRCYMHWTRREPEAIEWGTKGRDLKLNTNVDTVWSTDHALALAQRDFGQPDIALTFFLGGNSVEKFIDPDELEEDRDPSLYGNVGRCLQLMGQIDPALICYKKCAVLLQRDKHAHFENQGYIRSWIGQVLIAKKEFCAAKYFLSAAKLKWRMVAPDRASQLDDQLKEIEAFTGDCRELNNWDIERYVVGWIM